MAGLPGLCAGGLDPAQALVRLRITRSKGMIYPERVSKDFAFGTALFGPLLDAPSADDKAWHSIPGAPGASSWGCCWPAWRCWLGAGPARPGVAQQA